MNWSDGDLSAYVDGQLTEERRTMLEQDLQHDTALRSRLEALRQTVLLVRSAPLADVPRNFLLTPSMVAAPAKPHQRLAQRWYPVTRLATALTTLALVLVLGLQSLTPMAAPIPMDKSGGQVAMVPQGTTEPTAEDVTVMMAPEATAENTPEALRSLQAPVPEATTSETATLDFAPPADSGAGEAPVVTGGGVTPAPENWLSALSVALAGLMVMFGGVTWWLGRQR